MPGVAEMATDSNKELSEIRRISSSEAFLRFADSILSLDRDTVSNIIVAYLYFKSLRKTNREFLSFFATKRMGISIDIGFKLLPTLASGILTDRDFRSLMLAIVRSSIRKPEKESQP